MPLTLASFPILPAIHRPSSEHMPWFADISQLTYDRSARIEALRKFLAARGELTTKIEHLGWSSFHVYSITHSGEEAESWIAVQTVGTLVSLCHDDPSICESYHAEFPNKAPETLTLDEWNTQAKMWDINLGDDGDFVFDGYILSYC